MANYESICDGNGALKEPVAVYRGTCISFELEHKKSADCIGTFGGSLEEDIEGLAADAILDLIATINLDDLFSINSLNFPMPILYGFRHNGCELRYTYNTETNSVKLLAMRSKGISDDWPYEDYPEELPSCYLTIKDVLDVTFQELNKSLPQKLDDDSLIYLIFPSGYDYGVYLWDEEGDINFIYNLIAINPETGEVKSLNIC